MRIRSITATAAPLLLAAALLPVLLARWNLAAGLCIGTALTVALLLLLRSRLRNEAAALAGESATVSEEFRPADIARRRAAAAEADDRRALEAKGSQLEGLLQSMQDGVLGVDAGGRVAWTNAEMARILGTHGYGASIRIGRTLAHTLRDPALLDVATGVIEARSPATARTSTLLPGRILDVSVAPLPEGGAVLVFRDVTRAEQVEQAQRDFVANVSHELRTPLTSVRGYTETLLDSGLVAPEAEPWLDTVLTNVDRMQRLTEDLLVLARSEAADSAGQRSPVSVRQLVDDAVTTLRGTPEGATAQVDIAGLTDLQVLVDESAMHQVLGNLLENAIRYGRSDLASEARIALGVDLTSAGTVRIRVRDYGPGIAQAHHGRIFERFYRVDKARSRARGGTGLGLAIARHLVEVNGGTISLESNLGEGSEFIVELPLAPGQATIDQPQEVSAAAISPEPPTNATMNLNS